MTIVDMLSQSAILTLLGLGVVFSFIVIMIGAMHLLHFVLHEMHADEDPVVPAAGGVSGSSSSGAYRGVAAVPKTDNGAVVAAIAAALKQAQ